MGELHFVREEDCHNFPDCASSLRATLHLFYFFRLILFGFFCLIYRKRFDLYTVDSDLDRKIRFAEGTRARCELSHFTHNRYT